MSEELYEELDTDSENMTNIVSESSIQELPYIIAVDFDGTIVEDEFPQIGPVKIDTIERLAIAKKKECKLILWTCRTGTALAKAVGFCKGIGLEFDAINDNIYEVKKMGWMARKVYANEYWDDKAVSYFSQLTKSRINEF